MISRNAPRRPPRMTSRLALALVLMLLLAGSAVHPQPARAQTPRAEQLVSGLVRIRAFINPDGRTIDTLGRERSGNGIVIDSAGLILTIGYLMVEALAAEVETVDGRRVAAEIVGYDYDSGFGLLRATAPLNVRPLAFGRSADIKPGDGVLVARAGGLEGLGPAEVAATRVFAGYWEYLLDRAIFTTPPYPEWSGAALLNRDGRLVGVGSLIVADGSGKGSGPPSNMFVPIDLLPPILDQLLSSGKLAGAARPWLGLTTDEIDGRLVVRRVTPGGPAEKAGLLKGDIITAIGGEKTEQLPDLYRRIWSLGPAGVGVPLEFTRNGARQRLDVQSIDRAKHLKLNSTF